MNPIHASSARLIVSTLAGLGLGLVACSAPPSNDDGTRDPAPVAADAGDAGQPGTVPSCILSDGECTCSDKPFAPQAGTPVPSCDLPPNNVGWICTIDSDENGWAQRCSCVVNQCWKGTTQGADGDDVSYCGCGPEVPNFIIDDLHLVASCDPTDVKDGECCNEGPIGCGCTRRGHATFGGAVPACGQSDSTPAAACSSIPSGYADGTAGSCAGLGWAAPPPDAGAPHSTDTAASDEDDECAAGCDECSYCVGTVCVSCPIGDLGICTC